MNFTNDHRVLRAAGQDLADGRLSRREFLRTATLLGVAASSAYSLAGLAAPAMAQGTPQKGGTLRFGNRVHDISSPHTFAWSEASNLVRQTAETLVNIGPDNVARGVLLDSWSADDDLKVWTLNLRQGVKWMDGRDFTADDVVWNLSRLLDYKVGSSAVGLFQSFLLNKTELEEIDEKTGKPKTVWTLWDAGAIEKVDDFTVRLNGHTSNLAVPEYLSHYTNFMLDPAENGVFGVGSNGTGAFTVEEYSAGQRMVLKARTEGYWGSGPYLDAIEIIDLGDDSTAQVSALAAKQVDVLREGGVASIPVVEKLPHVRMETVESAYTSVARMQPEGPFADPKVRKAMRYATDSEACVKIALRGLGTAGEHVHVAPVHPEYAPMNKGGRDVEKARALLAEAGFADGFETEITCKSQPDWELLAVQAMVEQWKEIGVEASIKVVPSSEYWDNFTAYPFAFTQWGHRPLGTMVLELAYRSGVSWNESKWSNPEFDALLTEAGNYLDVEKRRDVMARIEEIMFEDGPIILPCWRAVFTFAGTNVQGFKAHPSLLYEFNEVWLEA